MLKNVVFMGAAAVLAACVPVGVPSQNVPEIVDPYGDVPMPTTTPGMVQPTTATTPSAGFGGLEQREPDACHAGDYVSALGKPAEVIPTLGITREYQVVQYRGIESQTYNARRILFRLDQNGNIYNIDCG